MLGSDPGTRSRGSWTLPAPCFSLENCLTSGAAAALGPGHSHNPVSCGFYSGFLLGILWVSVCVFQRLKPRHRSQVPCGHLHHCSKHCNPAMICQLGDWKNCFLPSFKRFRICSAHLLIFYTDLSNNCLVWDLGYFRNDHSESSKVLNFMMR